MRVQSVDNIIYNCIYNNIRAWFEMGKKRMTSIRIDGEIIDKAKELGLNISKTCENALKEAIRRLEGSNPKTNCNLTCASTSQQMMVRPPGFEPGLSAREADVLTRFSNQRLFSTNL